jgi:uncharacterized protein YjiS (DUF1127 family)
VRTTQTPSADAAPHNLFNPMGDDMTYMNAGSTTSAHISGNGFFAHAVAALGEMVAAYQAARRTDKAIAEMRAMNDHMLRDIGVTRSEIAYAVRNGR